MLEKIRDILGEYVEMPRKEIGVESAFIEDLGLSSLDVVDIIVAFEEAFDVEISDRKLMEIVTVGDVINLLNEEYGIV